MHQTERLRRDVARLHGRIEPFKGEVPLPERMFPDAPRLKWPVRDALNMLQEARDCIIACERDLSAIRGKIDGIEADAISREEMKPWLKR